MTKKNENLINLDGVNMDLLFNEVKDVNKTKAEESANLLRDGRITQDDFKLSLFEILIEG